MMRCELGNLKIKISKSAKLFLQNKEIEDITFNLIETDLASCCIRVAKEIVPVYEAPANASGYRYAHVDGHHIYVARKIKVKNPLTLSTEGIFKKQLCLEGALVPI